MSDENNPAVLRSHGWLTARMRRFFTHHSSLVTSLFFLTLSLYLLAGVTLTPVHPDESTQIAMSRDYAYQFLDRDFTRLLYNAPNVTAWEQELRLLNGTVNKYLIGAAWHLGGFTAADLNQQWDWGGSYDYNITTGHAPSAALLIAARWPSALLTVVSLWALGAIAWRLDGWRAAYPAALIYGLNALLLVNGRRAMMEGSWLAFSLLAVLAALAWDAARLRRSAWGWALLTGVSMGLAIASKHTAAFGLAGLVGGLAIAAVLARRRSAFGQLALMGAAAGLVFYALNPAWWGDPLGRAADVLRLRGDLLAGQTAAFGGFTSPGEAVIAYFHYGIAGQVQFYEVAGWDAYIGSAIAAYQASPWAGITYGTIGGAVLAGLSAIGLWALVRSRRLGSGRWIVVGWLIGGALAALLLTPLPWGRYYLPAVPVTALLAGLGVAWVLRGYPSPAEMQAVQGRRG